MEPAAAAPAHILLITNPAPGHCIPFAALARYLQAAGGGRLQVTCFTTGHVFPNLQHGSPQAHEIGGGGVRFEPLVEEAAPPAVTLENVMQWVQKWGDEEMKGILEAAVRRLTPPPCCIVADMLLGWVQDVADKIGVPRHTLYTMPASSLSFMLMVPSLIEQGRLPFAHGDAESGDPIAVPGVPPLRADDVWDLLKSDAQPYFDHLVRNFRRLPESASILVNSFEELEGETFRALRATEALAANSKVPAILPIGPLLQDFMGGGGSHDMSLGGGTPTEAEKWLDTQAPRSVIYVSFGSLGTLSGEQIGELALGLEATTRPFLWVFRPPGLPQVNNSVDPAAPHRQELFPPGFEERIKGRGMLIKGWAPQLQILAHTATGAFLSHCGWNSTLESICAGVPVLAWPLWADQKTNARFLVDVAEVGLDFNKNPEGLIERTEVEKVVAQMMGGDEGALARSKVHELKRLAREAMADGGSSRTNLESIFRNCSPCLQSKCTRTEPIL